MQDKNKYWIWLSRLTDTVKLDTLKHLLNIYGKPEIIWKLSKKDLIKQGVNLQEIVQIQSIVYRQNIENYMFYMQKEKIDIINFQEEAYPKKLRNISNWPIVLYCKGNKEILNDISIGIVGCRLCSNYGKMVAQKLAYQLAKENIIIVSGLARGIDTWSHIGCLKAKGKTIAVLGSGIDKMYPPENKGVFQKIIENGGAIISEYPVGTEPVARNFPRRNRLISGLTEGIVLVEAKRRSGSLITVDYALEQGKDVYAVPRKHKSSKFGRYK